MSDEKKPGANTVSPPGDPAAFAREIMAAHKPTPPVPMHAARPAPEGDDEIARLRSMALSDRPPPTSSASLLSLANAVAAAGGGDLRLGDSPRDLGPAAEVPAAGPPEDPVGEMAHRFSVGDYTGALELAESILEASPDHPEARRHADNCRSVLQQMYSARLGTLDRVPMVVVPREQLRWLSIDHRAGFLLSHVDGVSTMEMILDVSGMPTLDALRILYELLQQRVIAIK